MAKYVWVSLVGGMALFAGDWCSGQEPKLRARPVEVELNPDPRVSDISPFLDRHTELLVCINLQKFDRKAIAAKMASLLGKTASPTDLAALDVPFREFEEARKAGARRMYLLFRGPTADLTFFFLVSLEKGTDAKRLITLINPNPQQSPLACEAIGQVVFMGDKKAREALRALKPSPRPDICRAFAAAADTSLQLLILPGEESRKILPLLLAAGLDLQETPRKAVDVFFAQSRWAALGLDLGPKMRLRFVIQARDVEAANKLQKEAGNLLRILGNLKLGPDIFGVSPTKLAAKWLTPRLVSDQLVLDIEDPNLTTLLRPVLQELRKPPANK